MEQARRGLATLPRVLGGDGSDLAHQCRVPCGGETNALYAERQMSYCSLLANAMPQGERTTRTCGKMVAP
jgi:hypothetical protein